MGKGALEERQLLATSCKRLHIVCTKRVLDSVLFFFSPKRRPKPIGDDRAVKPFCFVQ